MLRTYNTLFSPFIDHSSVTKYVKFSLPFIVRKRLCQLRLGCLPLKIHTDRYIIPKVAPEQRDRCQPNCNPPPGLTPVENELHFLCQCNQYKISRQNLYNNIEFPGFLNMTVHNKFICLLTHPPLAKTFGQFIVDAFNMQVK